MKYLISFVHRSLAACFLIGTLIPFSSCSESAKTYPVEGKVAFNDGAPLTAGVVEFEAENAGSKRPNARGEIQADGTYRLTTFQDGDGAMEGSYRVIVVPERVVISNMSGPPPKMPIHPRFMSYDSSGLQFTVKSGPNQFNIAVERP